MSPLPFKVDKQKRLQSATCARASATAMPTNAYRRLAFLLPDKTKAPRVHSFAPRSLFVMRP
ncbi:MAG: hypothetical protein C4334_06690 [Pyrinomonas sp.]